MGGGLLGPGADLVLRLIQPQVHRIVIHDLKSHNLDYHKLSL